jgi:hypothetical protein
VLGSTPKTRYDGEEAVGLKLIGIVALLSVTEVNMALPFITSCLSNPPEAFALITVTRSPAARSLEFPQVRAVELPDTIKLHFWAVALVPTAVDFITR